MRSHFAAFTAFLLSSCATGPSVGSSADFQYASAYGIGGDLDPHAIKIHDRRAVLFTSYWTAMTPKGVYACSRSEDGEVTCKPTRS